MTPSGLLTRLPGIVLQELQSERADTEVEQPTPGPYAAEDYQSTDPNDSGPEVSNDNEDQGVETERDNDDELELGTPQPLRLCHPH